MSQKNNPSLSVSVPDPDDPKVFVVLESLYWLEYTPNGPVPSLALHREDASRNSKAFFDMRKQCYTFKEAKKKMVEWYMQRALMVDSMTEFDFDKMTDTNEMTRTEIREMLEYLENLNEEKPKMTKKGKKDDKKLKQPKGHAYDCSCVKCVEFWEQCQEDGTGVPMNNKDEEEPSQLEKNWGPKTNLKSVKVDRRLN